MLRWAMPENRFPSRSILVSLVTTALLVSVSCDEGSNEPTPEERLRSASRGPSQLHVVRGTARVVRGSFPSGGAPEDAAVGFLVEHGALFGIDATGDLQLREVRSDELSTVVILDRVHGELPVFGAEVRVAFAPDRTLTYVGARLPAAIEVAAAAGISADEATTAGVAASMAEGIGAVVADGGRPPVLGIWDTDVLTNRPGPTALAFRVDLLDAEGRGVVAFVDASDASPLDVWRRAYSGRDRLVAECNPGALGLESCATGDYRVLYEEAGPVVDAADPLFARAGSVYEHLAAAYAYYQTAFGRDSWDGEGGALRAFIRSGTGLYWDPRANAIELLEEDTETLELIVHEVGHGVILHEAPSFGTQGETGALGESIADAFACFATGDWSIDRQSRVERDLTQRVHPTRQHYVDDFQPGGEVHANSTIASLAAHLLSEGGANPDRVAEATIRGIGARKVEQIFYRAVTMYLTSQASFDDWRYQTLRACEDLVGRHSIVLRDCGELLEAFAAVGVGAWDHDRDTWGDSCRGIPADDCVVVDNCVPDSIDAAEAASAHNPDQADTDGNGTGDVCEAGGVDAGSGISDAGPVSYKAPPRLSAADCPGSFDSGALGVWPFEMTSFREEGSDPNSFGWDYEVECVYFDPASMGFGRPFAHVTISWIEAACTGNPIHSACSRPGESYSDTSGETFIWSSTGQASVRWVTSPVSGFDAEVRVFAESMLSTADAVAQPCP